jgi:hypothetical protein
VEVNVEGKNREHDYERHFGEQIAEAPNAMLEFGLRRPQF